jgi:hypothetical protein
VGGQQLQPLAAAAAHVDHRVGAGHGGQVAQVAGEHGGDGVPRAPEGVLDVFVEGVVVLGELSAEQLQRGRTVGQRLAGGAQQAVLAGPHGGQFGQHLGTEGGEALLFHRQLPAQVLPRGPLGLESGDQFVDQSLQGGGGGPHP